jgi:hypothetical protein
MLAAALLSCVLSGALPAEAVLNPGGLMACCRGMKGTAGECHGNSCPMHLGARSKAPTPSQHDPVCGVGRALQAVAGTPVYAPRNYFEQARSHDQAQAEVEHDHGESVTQRNTPQAPRQQPAAGVASLGRPCPSDCCGVADRQPASTTAGLRVIPARSLRPDQGCIHTSPKPPAPRGSDRSPQPHILSIEDFSVPACIRGKVCPFPRAVVRTR